MSLRAAVGHRLRSTYARHIKRHIQSGIAAETEFWDDYLATRPRGIADDAARAAAFPVFLRAHLRTARANTGRVPRMIELGPGPVSLLAWGVERSLLDLTAIDPLAHVYEKLLRRHGLAYPVRPVQGAGEDLRKRHARGSFDAAYSSNALDHTRSPLECLRNLSLVVRRGGIVFLEGFCREGSNAGWEGLHQHDLLPDNGCLVHLDRHGRRTDLTAGLALRCILQHVGPFTERGIRSFGYEAGEGAAPGWVYFDWYTMAFEVTA